MTPHANDMHNQQHSSAMPPTTQHHLYSHDVAQRRRVKPLVERSICCTAEQHESDCCTGTSLLLELTTIDDVSCSLAFHDLSLAHFGLSGHDSGVKTAVYHGPWKKTALLPSNMVVSDCPNLQRFTTLRIATITHRQLCSFMYQDSVMLQTPCVHLT